MKYIIYFLIFMSTCSAYALPSGFVYLKQIDPSIKQDIRYASNNNFIGRQINGYQQAECILTYPTALALTKIQQQLHKKNQSLIVFDCYRPTRAVTDFIDWSRIKADQKMKSEYYPRINKLDFFRLGYVAVRSGHSRGSTVDLSIVKLPWKERKNYSKLLAIKACYAPNRNRLLNEMDMGTEFDCMDEASQVFNHSVGETAYKNRLYLRQLMGRYGFEPYNGEWWHFTLDNEPYKNTYFDFIV